MINTVRDRILILKESIKSSMRHGPITPRPQAAQSIIKTLGIKNARKVILGKPDILIIITDEAVIRTPFGRLSRARCRINKLMLQKLEKTSIAAFVPRFLKENRYEGKICYWEQRLPGMAIDLPLNKMDELVKKAADFITRFHQETAQDLVINETNFKSLFSRGFERLSYYLDRDYQIKLFEIENRLKQQLFGKPFKTVWLHGDYKIENVLFDTNSWEIKGIIDWDLSHKNGLPLLDILYLLLYKESLFTGKRIGRILLERALKMDFTPFEKEVISAYAAKVNMPEGYWPAMLIMFWVHHISQRYQQQLLHPETATEGWMREEVYAVIDVILNNSNDKLRVTSDK